MNKNNLKVGTRVTFYPVDGAAYSAEGEIVKRYEAGRSGAVSYSVRVASGTGAGKDLVLRAKRHHLSRTDAGRVVSGRAVGCEII